MIKFNLKIPQNTIMATWNISRLKLAIAFSLWALLYDYICDKNLQSVWKLHAQADFNLPLLVPLHELDSVFPECVQTIKMHIGQRNWWNACRAPKNLLETPGKRKQENLDILEGLCADPLWDIYLSQDTYWSYYQRPFCFRVDKTTVNYSIFEIDMWKW